jgi:acetyl-CoA carboxylase biotin carboxyl carrier protein
MGLAEPMAKDTKGKGSSDQALIRDLAELLEETGLSEIEIEREGMRVRVARQVNVAAPVYAAASAHAPAAAAAPAASHTAGRIRPRHHSEVPGP